MNYRVEKTWNGFVSVRSNAVNECVAKRENLVIHYDAAVMTIPFSNLLHPLQLVPREIKSKFKNGGTYKLYDFKWIPDGQKVAAQFKQGQLL